MRNHTYTKRYWTENNRWFDELYTKTTWFDRRFRKDVYQRWAVAREICANHKGATVLDVGCGSGHVALSLVQDGAAHVTGVDFSDSMLRLAGEIFEANNLKEHLTLIRGDIMNESTVTGKFDVVIGLGLFDYVRDARALWLKLLQCSGHYVVASFPAPTGIRSALRKLRYGIKGCPVYFYSRVQLESLVRHQEFEIDIRVGQAGFFVIARRIAFAA